MAAVEAGTQVRTRPWMNVGVIRDYAIVGFFVALVIVLSISSDVFLSEQNLKNVIDQAVAVGLVACAGSLVLMAGGFDLSAGAIYVAAGVVSAQVANSTSAGVGIAAGIGIGASLGLINALLCTVLRLNAFVATLGTSIAFAGLATVLSGGTFTFIQDESFGKLSQSVLGVKVSTWIFVAFVAACAFVLNKTVLGRWILATGGNPTAARLSGVPINITLAFTYVLSGAAAGVAAVIVASRSMSVSGTNGSDVVFDALAAILIGGVSVAGGEGAIWRVIIGVFILALISNGFNLNGIDPLYQQVVSGLLILVAVGVDTWLRRRST